jgi:4a-hydroxytetrahydrobiopterin dehydratase
MSELAPARIKAALARAPKWQKQPATIRRTFAFKDFVAAMKFVNAAAELAEAAGHHPDIDVRWNQVTLTLTTHDAGGLTAKDFALARQLDAAALRVTTHH